MLYMEKKKMKLVILYVVASVSVVVPGKRKHSAEPSASSSSRSKKGKSKSKDKQDKAKKDTSKKKKVGRKGKEIEKRKKKKETSSSGSSGSSSSDSDVASSNSSASSDVSSSGSSESEADAAGKRARDKKRRKVLAMEMLDLLWPKEDRPLKLQKKKNIAGMSMSKLMRMKDLYDKEQAKRGLGVAVFSRDRKPKTRKFNAGKDDGEKRLHPARWESLPRVEPSLYWQQVPTAKEEIYRHLPLQHIGVEAVPELTIVKLHDRKVPIELDMCRKDIKDMRQAQIAVCNYVAIMRQLHPVDMGGTTIQLVLTAAGWAESLGESEKNRLMLVKRFFNDCMTENSGRAVRREPPMAHDQVIKCTDILVTYVHEYCVLTYLYVQTLTAAHSNTEVSVVQ
jgi:hypothetical protein